MPLTLVDYEHLAKRSRGQAHVLMLEVLNRRTLLTGFLIFYAFIMLYLAEVFYNYWITWSCQTVCGTPVSLEADTLDINTLKNDCRYRYNASAGQESNHSLFGPYDYLFVGTNQSVQSLNRFIQYQFVYQNPRPEFHGTYTIYFDVYYALQTPVGHMGIQNLVLKSVCMHHQQNCLATRITHIDSPWDGNYSLSLLYNAMYAQLSNGTIVDLDDTYADYGVVLMCYHNWWRTVTGLTVRYTSITVLLFAVSLVVYFGRWPSWRNWVPEQCWSIGLIGSTLCYLNPLYAALVFASGPDIWGFSFLQAMEYQVRLVGPTLFMAFELVAVSSCQGVQTFLFGWVYCPTAFALIWTAAYLATQYVGSYVYGLDLVIGVIGLFTLPPESPTVYLLCCTSLIILSAVWYVWFGALCIEARSILRRSPYLGTRCRQLTFRLILLWWVPKEMIYLTLLIVNATNKSTYAGVLRSDQRALFAELVLSMLNAVSVLLMFMPAARRDDPGFWQWFIKRGTEGDFFLYEAEARDAETSAQSDTKRKNYRGLLSMSLAEWDREEKQPLWAERFCVETAMIMYNLAFEVYMEPPIGFRPVGDVQSAAFTAATAALTNWQKKGAMDRWQYLQHCRLAVSDSGTATQGTQSKVESGKYDSIGDSQPDLGPSQFQHFGSSAENLEGAFNFEGRSWAQVPGQVFAPVALLPRPANWRVTFNNNIWDTEDDNGDFTFEQPHTQLMRHPYVRESFNLAVPYQVQVDPVHKPVIVPMFAENDVVPQESESSVDYPISSQNTAVAHHNSENSEESAALPSNLPLIYFAKRPSEMDVKVEETYDIQQLEAMLKLKKRKKRQKILNQRNMEVERYGYKLWGVISCEANQAMVVISKDYIGVSFRGTSNAENVRTDLKFLKTPYTAMMGEHAKPGALFSRVVHPRVHSGFYEAWCALKEETMAKIQEAVLTSGHRKFYISGHSLGGAIATLAAYEISRRYPGYLLVIYTFGSPRVGNVEFCRQFDRQVPCMWRIENERDVVPTVPPKTALYGHVGKTVRVDGDGLLILQPSYLESFHYSRSDRVASHMLSRYRKSLEAICHDFNMALHQEVAPYGRLWEFD